MQKQIVFGYVTTWNTPHVNGFGELQRFERSDCLHAIRNPSCKVLVNHNESEEVGSIADAGLLLKADDHGLLAAISCALDEKGRDVYLRVLSGELCQMSMLELSSPHRADYVSHAQRVKARHIDKLNEVTLCARGRNGATAAIAAESWQRHYLDSFSVGDAREKLARLASRGWASPADVTLAQSLGRRLSLHRLSRIAHRNLHPSRPPEYLGCPAMTLDIDMSLRGAV